MKILGIIPARGGSKGIPKKNIKVLNGKPLIEYTINAAKRSKLDRVVVSTEDDEIAAICHLLNVEVISRPDNLAADNTPTKPVLQDVINRLDEKFDAVMTLQPTSPLRSAEDINNAIKLFSSDKQADSLVSVVVLSHNFYPEKLMSFDGKYLQGNSEVKRRQELNTSYFARNGAAIYITKIDRLDEYIFGGKIVPYFMNKLHSFDIDDMDDWSIVERLMK